MQTISLVKLFSWFLLMTLGCLSLLIPVSFLTLVLVWAAWLITPRIPGAMYGFMPPPLPIEFRWAFAVPIFYSLVLGLIRIFRFDGSWELLLQHPTAIVSLWALCLGLSYRAWLRWWMDNLQVKTDAEQTGSAG